MRENGVSGSHSWIVVLRATAARASKSGVALDDDDDAEEEEEEDEDVVAADEAEEEQDEAEEEEACVGCWVASWRSEMA
jgi:hypothetical protein